MMCNAIVIGNVLFCWRRPPVFFSPIISFNHLKLRYFNKIVSFSHSLRKLVGWMFVQHFHSSFSFNCICSISILVFNLLMLSLIYRMWIVTWLEERIGRPGDRDSNVPSWSTSVAEKECIPQSAHVSATVFMHYTITINKT